MPTIVLETFIDAPAETCFELVRDARVHAGHVSRGDAAASAGAMDGSDRTGQRFTFESALFGFRQRVTVEVVEFERPRRFVDEMIAGPLKSFRHIHEFSRERGGTLLRDTVMWRSPFGIVGAAADKFFIERHLRGTVASRNARLKRIAESDPDHFIPPG